MKIYTRYFDRSNRLLSADATITDRLPEVGDEYHSYPVTYVGEANVDSETYNAFPDAADYDFYVVVTRDPDGGDTFDYYLAVPKQDSDD